MPILLHHFIEQSAARTPEALALIHKKQQYSYEALWQQIRSTADGFTTHGLTTGERVAVLLPKLPQTVFALFGTARAGGVFVPVNPLLKPQQVAYILQDCNVRILVTSSDRLKLLEPSLQACHDLRSIVLVDERPVQLDKPLAVDLRRWSDLSECPETEMPRRIDTDMVSILYTSGSTGNPKGVVLSHKNMVAGAESVAEYLGNTSKDRLLAVLPFSFDYGLSQMTTAFSVGASVVLMDYLLPRDVIRTVAAHEVTGLAAVPPLWNQLADLEWPPEAAASLRYLTNSGGAMPKATTAKLRASLPKTDFFLMYGLTEAFRSTYLPPEQVDIRPDSMGKAIPNAEILVVREDGSECAPGEPGELVHRGSLVALGYWNDPQKTNERFKPAPGQPSGIPLVEIAVWSGDQVRRDEEGFLYFISRKDEMIKTSGYRVSPTEIEEVLYSSGLVKEVAALGIAHPTLGQGIVLAVTGAEGNSDRETIIAHCKSELPNFMVPQEVFFHEALPRNQNGKIDRKKLSGEYLHIFQQDE